jgi:hypothetical protein
MSRNPFLIGLLIWLAGIPGFRVNSQSLVVLSVSDYGASGDGIVFDTREIQNTIDVCAAAGGGTVIFPEGIYLTGALYLRSHVTLWLQKGAVIRGSSDYSDYGTGRWWEALINGDKLQHISIQGEGTLDGVDCFNPHGEEGFRGPHAIRFRQCKVIVIKGITIVRAANWAINCRNCDSAHISGVHIRGGHDGLHTRFCSNFTIDNCDFRTGDDAFAGCDNRNFTVSNCKVNSSCNGFRFSCQNFKVTDCYIWGPGEYEHKSSHRTNMLAAFVHFSPGDENPQLASDKWIIQNVTVKQADCIYSYHQLKGKWQNGQPVASLIFENLKAADMIRSFYIIGDAGKQLSLVIRNSELGCREGATVPVFYEGNPFLSACFFYIENFGSVDLKNVTLNHCGTVPVLNCKEGNYLYLENMDFNPSTSDSLVKIENILTLKHNKHEVP